jgi:putative cell wall-binding protein
MTVNEAPPKREPSAEPWRYGPYRMVVTRRVTEEEQISVEAYEQTREIAIETFELFLAKCREHMIAHNERIVMAHKDHLIKLERIIENRAEEIRDLDEQIAQRKAELRGEDNDEANGHAVNQG